MPNSALQWDAHGVASVRHGRARVAKFVVGILTWYREDATLAWCEANGPSRGASVARG